MQPLTKIYQHTFHQTIVSIGALHADEPGWRSDSVSRRSERSRQVSKRHGTLWIDSDQSGRFSGWVNSWRCNLEAAFSGGCCSVRPGPSTSDQLINKNNGLNCPDYFAWPAVFPSLFFLPSFNGLPATALVVWRGLSETVSLAAWHFIALSIPHPRQSLLCRSGSAPDTDAMSCWCWATVCDGGPASTRHCVNISCVICDAD